MYNHVPTQKIEPIFIKELQKKPKYINVLSEFYQKGWFENKDLDAIANIILKYYQKYSKLPSWKTIELVASKYYEEDNHKNISRQIESLKELNTEEYNEEALDEEVLNYIQNTGLYWTIMGSLESIEQKKSVDSCIDTMTKLVNVDFDDDLGLMYYEQIEHHISELQKPDVRVSTGIKCLDDVMQGGPPREGKCLTTFVGETHIGKSLMLSNIALNMALNGEFVIIYSMEMSEEVYGMRIDAHNTNIDINQVDKSPDKIRKGAENLKKCGDGEILIKEFPSGITTPQHLRTHAEWAATKIGKSPSAIFVDYLSLLAPTNGGKNSNLYERVGTIATQIRGLSYIFNCPVYTCNQINREGYENNQPGLQKISDSMGVAHVSDYIGILWQNEGDKELGILQQVIRKNRYGGHVSENLRFNINYLSLTINDYQLSTNTSKNTENISETLNQELEDL